MSATSPLLLIGIGTAGSSIARGVSRAYGDGLRYLLVDTDVVSGQSGSPFLLLGGDRLSGRGTGGDVVTGRLAAEDSIRLLDDHLEGVRVAVVVTALGGGTGGGATLETCKHLSEKGIPSVVFATMPFSFEGDDRQRSARGIVSMVEDAASATFLLPLDKLIGNADNMDEALRRAIDTVASGVTLFWRLVETPGYIRLDAERIRHLIAGAGRGRFATVTAQGPGRVSEALEKLLGSEILSTSTNPVRAALCGVLAGNDLLLTEVGRIADGVKKAFGGVSFDLATVNDEATFSGRISVVVMLFESAGAAENESKPGSVMSGRRKRAKGVPVQGAISRGRFKNAQPTIWNGEDLDIPTFIRRNISIDA